MAGWKGRGNAVRSNDEDNREWCIRGCLSPAGPTVSTVIYGDLTATRRAGFAPKKRTDER